MYVRDRSQQVEGSQEKDIGHYQKSKLQEVIINIKWLLMEFVKLKLLILYGLCDLMS